ncbi:MAG TPA: 50S ribosomal protein L22 [Candidatus Saccharimonadia bacterium]|nr:50S ribosomal protein L22 [Candidatus Saccharimonadia bacterium]
MSAQAIARGVNMSPRKVGVVAGLVRGRTVAEALTILDHTPRASSEPVRKVIESAKANATYNHSYKEDSLRISEIYVTPGTSLKRYRSIARGSFHQILKRTSHIKVVLDGEKRQPKKTEPTAKEETTSKETK